MSEEYLTVKDAAEYLGLSEHTLNKWRSDKKNLRYSLFGRKVRYKKSVLNIYKETHNLLKNEVEIIPEDEKYES